MYGPVRTVVWEGRSRKAPPYPDPWPHFRRERMGRACRLCPSISDVNLFRYREGIIYLNAEVSYGAFDFCVSEQELNRPQIPGSTVD